MPDGLVDGFATLLAGIEGVELVTVLPAATMRIVSTQRADGTIVDKPRPGFVIPVSGLILEPAALETFVGISATAIATNELVLSESSAALRRLEVGDSITFESGATLTIGAIAPDSQADSYEVIALSPEYFVAERIETRAAAIVYGGAANRLQLEIASLLDEEDLFQVRARNTSPYNGALVVRSQIFIKETFGEFAYRPMGNGRFIIDPAWVEENIVEVDIPLLGQVKCHRVFADVLTGVMLQLVEAGMSGAIDRDAFAGCWNGRYIAGSHRLSRHSFGAAADINFFNPLDGGPGSPVNPTLLRLMSDAGVTSGDAWTNPDPGHFEYFGFPD